MFGFLVKSDSYTTLVDVGSLAGTQLEALSDDHLVIRNVCRFVFIVDVDFDFGGHGDSESS